VRRIVASAASLTLLSFVAAASGGQSPDSVSIAMPPSVDKHPAAVAAVPVVPTPSPDPSPEQPTATPTERTSPEPAPASEKPKPEEANPQAAKPKPIDTPTRSLYLAVGHGRAPNGKLQVGSIDPRTGIQEIDAAAVIVEAMVDVLERAPNLRLWAESGREHPNLIGTVARANRRGADDCIEVHQDWHRAPPGAFAHWYPGARSAEDLANRLVRGLREEGVSTRDRWHKPRPGLYFLRETTCRAVLVEVGRVGDFTKKELREYGRALAVAYIKDIRERS
jgi:N-acetylmuramoyl-L-alanine amidase